MPDFKFKIYDDILTGHQIKKISDVLLSTDIPWSFYNKTVTDRTFDKQKNITTYEYMQFVHIFNDYSGHVISDFSGITDYILKKFRENTGVTPVNRLRTKMNLQPKSTLPGHNTPHVDFPNLDHWVLLYYVCDSDGDTCIFNDNIVDTISPKAGRYLLFNGSQSHAGSHPLISDKRVVINFNFTLN